MQFTQHVWLVSLLILSCHSSPSDHSPTMQENFQEEIQENSAPISTVSFVMEEEPDSLSQAELDSIHSAYRQVKANIKAKRTALQGRYEASNGDVEAQRVILQQARDYLLHTIPDELLPYWYGTPWDFNGYSNQPREGVIACGYFVSTPLKHIGFPINRYRVAQQAAAIIVDTLCSDKWSYRNVDRLIEDLLSKPDELYIVGLDYHVGFLLKRGTDIHFIHSSYYDPVAVVKEDARNSLVFHSSNLYVVGPLLTENGGLSQWFFAE